MIYYQIALFVHLSALLSAAVAGGIMHLASRRRERASTLREAMDWARLMGSTAKVFPIAILILIASGSYMVSLHWTWTTGFVQAGLTGAIALLAFGAVAAVRSGADVSGAMKRLQEAGHDLPNDAMPDRVASVLGETNPALALSIVLVMTIKQDLATSLALLAVGAAIGTYLGVAHVRAVKQVPGETSEAEAA